jgi:hypothetical protein
VRIVPGSGWPRIEGRSSSTTNRWSAKARSPVGCAPSEGPVRRAPESQSGNARRLSPSAGRRDPARPPRRTAETVAPRTPLTDVGGERLLSDRANGWATSRRSAMPSSRRWQALDGLLTGSRSRQQAAFSCARGARCCAPTGGLPRPGRAWVCVRFTRR